ncbi:MAG: ABC transporter ATP-binding protein [Ardenticatenaceae bacterium]|nr:ABC transporter ATP-binding protein [Ardenticatenaceae bacterium]
MKDLQMVFEAKSLTKIYPGASKAAVSDLNLTLHSGEVVALLGPNGAGKTTAVKMIAGLVLPTTGHVCVMEHDIVQARTVGVRHIGAVLEGARNLYWRLSAEENLRYFGTLRLTPRRELSRRIDELLVLFDLEAQRHQEVRHFSRGMQQKLAIAAALIHDPDLLLLDEPTLGLDVKAARQLEEIITQLAQEQGKAILLTTHMMDVAEKLAKRIIVIYQGREVVSEETRSLLHRYSAQRDMVEIHIVGVMTQAFEMQVQRTVPGVVFSDENGSTRLLLPALDQAQLLRLLQQLDAEGITIQEVGRRRARLEEIFLSLTGSERADV